MQSLKTATIDQHVEGRSAVLRCGGSWLISQLHPKFEEVEQALDALEEIDEIILLGDSLEKWDSSLLLFARKCSLWAEKNAIHCNLEALPKGVFNLISLSQAVPEQKGNAAVGQLDWLTRVGLKILAIWAGLQSYCTFFGQFLIDLVHFCRGKARFRREDFWNLLESTGPKALPIVSLLSFLTGLIIAFIGVIQLQKFAADIYVADLVGLAITRELGAVMAGVIMAGRTGAAFAAQIGSMKVNEEIDALTSFGISPIQFLVLPRVLVLVLMMPLLCIFADVVGIVGGLVVAVSISDVSIIQYCNQLSVAVDLSDFLSGVFKSVVFGVIIAFAGCFRGLNCGKDANAVGLAATSAVVTSISWIVLADAIFAVIFNLLGI